MFKLAKDLTIHNVEQVQQELLNYIEASIKKNQSQLKLDGGGVEDIDAVGVQILLSAYITAQQEEIDFSLLNSSSFLIEALNISGANDILNLKEEQNE